MCNARVLRVRQTNETNLPNDRGNKKKTDICVLYANTNENYNINICMKSTLCVCS